MILDSSSLAAIAFDEPERSAFLERIRAADVVGIGAPTLVETGVVVVARIGEQGRELLARLVRQADVTIIPFEAAHASVAADAWLRYGRGRHPAALNFGDCLAYATARVANRPLLCKGADFALTDVALA